jgi:hypothetical protein
MKNTINELNTIVKEFSTTMMEIPDSDFSTKPQQKKWSKKEIVGHLIDSGQNNLRRFICGQYESIPPKIVYDQDFWVAANNYQQYDQKDIIELWKLTNTQISSILAGMPETNYKKTARSTKDTDEEKTLEWLAADYVKHMKHHLNQIFEKSFDITYP